MTKRNDLYLAPGDEERVAHKSAALLKLAQELGYPIVHLRASKPCTTEEIAGIPVATTENH
jgi:hypothetical protein